MMRIFQALSALALALCVAVPLLAQQDMGDMKDMKNMPGMDHSLHGMHDMPGMLGPYGTFAYACCKPVSTDSINSRERRASASTPRGSAGRGTSGSKMFSNASGIVRPVFITGANSL